jgi:hypothetical protein
MASSPDESPSPQPPTASIPLGGLIIPVVAVLAILFGGYFFVIPLFKDVSKAQDNYKKAIRPIPQPTQPYDPLNPRR